jgi:hypothetical protein
MHKSLTQGNEHEKVQKPAIIKDHIWHMGYMNNGARMSNTYSVSWRMQNWTNKLFFCLLDVRGQAVA